MWEGVPREQCTVLWLFILSTELGEGSRLCFLQAPRCHYTGSGHKWQ